MNHETIITSSKEETQELAEKLAKTLSPGSIIALYGNLGSGKTTFVQGLAKGLGITKRLISPTFVIVRQYELGIRNPESGIKMFYHIDLYRIESQKDLKNLGLKEIINNPENIVAIEWPEKAQNLLPKNRIEIHLEYLLDNKRQIEIKTYE